MLPHAPRPALTTPTLATLLATLLVLGLLGGLLLGPAGPPSYAGDDRDPVAPVPAPDRGLDPDRHSSDGVPGTIVPRTSLAPPTGKAPPAAKRKASGQRIAPGVSYTSWRQNDRRGPIRAHLLAVDLDRKGVAIDVVNPGTVSATATVRTLAERRKAVAAVNGDFFDIGRTGASLGVTRSPRQGLLNARSSGWNQAFYVTKRGNPQFGEVPLRGSIKQRPAARITNLNSHLVLPDGIGVYNDRWGRSPGYAVTQGQTKQVRQVELYRGKVVANRGRLRPDRPIKGLLLVGRGEGATQLRKLGTGRAQVKWHLKGRPQLVVTGNKLLIDDGKVVVVDDTEMHPRTAVGIDRDTGELLMLVVDGRSEKSRGYTMLELALLMADLGADEALNLDGGGSSTMVGKRDRELRTLNRPSDGQLRQVANALTVSYRKPR